MTELQVKRGRGRPRVVPDLPDGDHFYDERWWRHRGKRRRALSVEDCARCGQPFLADSEAGTRHCSRTCAAMRDDTIGRRKKNNFGYVLVRMSPDDPLYSMAYAGKATKHWVLEHRLIVARSLGRPLRKDEVVHHINGKKDDNRLENLQLVMKESHSSGQALICRCCGSSDIERVGILA